MRRGRNEEAEACCPSWPCSVWSPLTQTHWTWPEETHEGPLSSCPSGVRREEILTTGLLVYDINSLALLGYVCFGGPM